MNKPTFIKTTQGLINQNQVTVISPNSEIDGGIIVTLSDTMYIELEGAEAADFVAWFSMGCKTIGIPHEWQQSAVA